MNAAANGNRVVQVTWQNIRTYDYNGKLLDSTSLSNLIQKAGLDPMPKAGKGPFEPHVVFSEFIGRWVITASCRHDCLLVSASEDPMGSGWRLSVLPRRRTVPLQQSQHQTGIRQEWNLCL
jgi:hypothetical protein